MPRKPIQLMVVANFNDDAGATPDDVACALYALINQGDYDKFMQSGSPGCTSVEICDGASYREEAEQRGRDMFDELGEAVQLYTVTNGHPPVALADLEGVGGHSPERTLHELFSPETDFELHVAAAIIESGAFDNVKGELDRGTWLNQDDPVASVKSQAYYLYQAVTVRTAAECVKKLTTGV